MPPRKSQRPTGGAEERARRLEALDRDARRILPRGPGRPVGTGDPGGAAPGPAPAPGDPPVPSGVGAPPPNFAIVAADQLRARTVDAIRGYHEMGFFFTGHAHWHGFKPERVEAASVTLAEVIATLPPNIQAWILLGLAWSSVALVAGEMFVAPWVVSTQIIKREREAKKKAEGTPPGGPGGADK